MKRKVNLNRPQISSEEILKRKNFDSVLKSHIKVNGKPLLKKPWFLSSVIAVTIAAVVTVVLLNKTSNNQQPKSSNELLTTNADSLALEAFYKSEEAKPCISPPIKGLNVSFTTFKVISEKGANLDFKTGSKLIIPKNAFADESGKLVKGEVELRYREFHDPADFFVSGIPMTYDSAGVKYQFESAGMMDMQAFQNGKKINMAPQKSINVELASDYNGTEYNLYQLDTVKNNWSCLGKDKVKNDNKNTSVKSLSSQLAAPKLEETAEYKTLDFKKVEIQKQKEVEIAALPKPLPEPKKPEQVKKGKFVESFEVNYSEFPELTAFKDVLWEVGAENKNFDEAKQKYITKTIVWESAYIKEGPKKGENYILALSKGNNLKEEIIVYPVLEGGSYETAMKNYQGKFDKYKITLDKRIASEKRVEEDYQASLAAIKKQQEDLEFRWKRQQDDLFKKMDTSEKVLRMFAINSFGVFNCDNPSVYPQGVKCSAIAKTDTKRDLKCYNIYLVDKQKNGLFTYTQNPISSFSFNPKSKNMLWTVEDGVLYWLKPEQFSSISGSNGLSDLIMNKVEQKFATVDEMKAYFNF